MPATRVPTAISESNKHPGPPFGGPGCLYSGKGRSGRMLSAPTGPWQMPRSFKGMAPMAARRAHPVQRSSHQGLPGNPDACRPRRGSACNMSARKTSGDARSVFALPVRRTAAMSPRIGGPREGGAPRPFFPPISLGRNGGARRAGIRREAWPPPDGRILSAPTGLAVGVPRWSGPHLGRRRAGSYPTDGAPAAQASGNPSSAPVSALGHLPPAGGKAPGARCAPPGDTPVSGQKSTPPGIRAALVFTALRGNTPNQGWQAAACRGCCAGR